MSTQHRRETALMRLYLRHWKAGQQVLAKRLGVSRPLVSNWLRGTAKVAPHHYPALADSLSIAERTLARACRADARDYDRRVRQVSA